MTRIKSLLAATVVAAIAAVTPAANAATNVHFVGAGSSAQFNMAAIGADQAAINANTALYGGAETVQHWTFKNGATVADNRDTLNRILPELGNIWLVWLVDGSGNVTDVWTDVSVDSTVGVRTFSAQESISSAQVSGGQVQINQASGTAGGNLISPATLWPDNNADVALSANALAAINTSVSGGVHVNVGLTDIRPEDALFATKRSIAALNTTTYAGLGYVGPTINIGAPILTDQGTGTAATPIEFALQGKTDPFTHFTVPAYTTIPLGAAPIVFIANNGGSLTFPRNMISGVTPGLHVTGQTYPAEQLFAGLTACDTAAAAFGGPGNGTGTALTVLLREPLSGTMNTTEFSLFRSFDNKDGSQETGVINPTRSPYNPLALGCPTHGVRQRAIGTGEVVNAVKADTNSIGYIFYGFANAAKLVGANYNYLTLDGVDPLALTGTTSAQELPNCTTPTCSASLWPSNLSYPHLRDGTYKAWSIYRWLAYNSGLGDAYGPALVAQLAQDNVDQDIADFVPFATSSGSDGLEVYRSHFTQETVVGNNGSATVANSLDGGNTLGGGTEAGGDEGGLIEGPFGTTLAATNGYVTTTSTLTAGKGYKVSWKAGAHFTAGTSWEGSTITIGGVNFTVSTCATCTLTATSLYVTTNPGANTIAEAYSAPFAITYPAATAPGVLNKHQ